MRMGLVQNDAVAGDLSGNLRRVVQGCRACTDGGADLILASAHALDGVFPSGLRVRSSFLLQAQAALRALSAELSTPLILASHAARPHESSALPHPYLLHRGDVLPLENHAIAEVADLSLYIDVGDAPTPAPRHVHCDAIVHLPTAPWLPGQRDTWQAMARDEAAECQAAVFVVRSIGSSGGLLAAGGSFACTPEGQSQQLPFFRDAELVWQPAQTHAETEPTLFSALSFCLRDMLRQSEYRGFAVPADTARSNFLLTLVQAIVGESSALPITPPPHHTPRAAAAAMADAAEDQDLLFLSPHSLCDSLLGEAIAPPGSFAPLGDMLDSQISELREQAMDSLQRELPPIPPARDTEQALVRLALEHRSPAEIATLYGTDETLLRRILRRLNQASASLVPPTAKLHIREALIPLPPYHKLSE